MFSAVFTEFKGTLLSMLVLTHVTNDNDSYLMTTFKASDELVSNAISDAEAHTRKY